jgi:cell division protein FtsI (penicillin-binding protein 3)
MVSTEKRGIHRFFYVLTATIALAIFVRLGIILFGGGNQVEKTYRNPIVSAQVVRGTITDRNGNILAIETPYHSVALMLREVRDLDTVANLLSPAIGMTKAEIIANTVGRSSYALIKRRLTTTEHDEVQQIIARERLRGVVLEKRYGRTYPQQFHAAQIIGFTNTENVGIEGLELAYDRILSPYPLLSTRTTYGADIQLTLDMDLQFLLDSQAVEIDRLHQPDHVVGIIMDALTGDILAATTFPWYDPNQYNISLAEQRQNRIITYMYEPGSVFKIFSLAAEMQAGQADFTESFECDGSYTFTLPGGNTTTINCVTAHGSVTPHEMITKSCNGAVAHWALQTDDQDFHRILAQMGFGSALDIGLQGSISGRFPSVASWSGRTKATLAFGQELGVTALQMATAATMFSNGGSILNPNLIKGITDHEGKLLKSSSVTFAEKNVIDASIAQEILSYMVGATQSGGTATRTAVQGVQVASKTGTSQILDPLTNTYKEGTFLASTLSIVPADDPAYIIYIAAANPKGSTIWGSNIAAPAIQSIIEDMVRQGKLQSNRIKTIRL